MRLVSRRFTEASQTARRGPRSGAEGVTNRRRRGDERAPPRRGAGRGENRCLPRFFVEFPPGILKVSLFISPTCRCRNSQVFSTAITTHPLAVYLNDCRSRRGTGATTAETSL